MTASDSQTSPRGDSVGSPVPELRKMPEARSSRVGGLCPYRSSSGACPGPLLWSLDCAGAELPG